MRTEDYSLPDRKPLSDSENEGFAEKAKRAQKGRRTRPFCALDGFNEISLTLLEGMAGTTRLELATSAVTASFGNCLKLRGTDGYQNHALEPQVTNIGP
jgi:hypothetical protein